MAQKSAEEIGPKTLEQQTQLIMQAYHKAVEETLKGPPLTSLQEREKVRDLN